jgi:antirestriction protein ArdC
MGSAMSLNRLGIDTDHSTRNSAAYIKGWLENIKGDNKFVVSAASKAEKAVKMIFGDEVV